MDEVEVAERRGGFTHPSNHALLPLLPAPPRAPATAASHMVLAPPRASQGSISSLHACLRHASALSEREFRQANGRTRAGPLALFSPPSARALPGPEERHGATDQRRICRLAAQITSAACARVIEAETRHLGGNEMNRGAKRRGERGERRGAGRDGAGHVPEGKSPSGRPRESPHRAMDQPASPPASSPPKRIKCSPARDLTD